MTINQAISLVDTLKTNQIERERKIEWLSRLDQWVFEQVIKPRQFGPGCFKPYCQPHLEEGMEAEGTGDIVLLIPAPWDETYRFYLEMQIDLANQELDKYVNSANLYQTAKAQFIRAYNRQHRRLDKYHRIHF